MSLLRFASAAITGIIHVGAHEAQEMDEYLDYGVEKILWVEANPFFEDILSKKIRAWSSSMKLGIFAASKRSGGKGYLNIANNLQSSSLLELGSHLEQHPEIKYASKVEVDLKAIDDWISESNYLSSLYNAINIDIQGYELEALQGMIGQLRHVVAIDCEVNLKDVYLGCPTIHDIDKFMSGHGFRRIITSLARDSLYGNALYVKPKIFPIVLVNALRESLARPRKALSKLKQILRF